MIFTSITGGKNILQENQPPGKYVAFLETPQESKTWEIRPAYNKFVSPRRNSRIHKILPHQFLKTRYSLWIDGTIELLVPMEELIERFLKDHDIAMFKHPGRDCLYSEAMVCATEKLDDPETIIEQVKKYEEEGFGKNRGLCEGSFILRRHTDQVEDFNNYWWSEHCRHSVRDQISMFYALDKAKLVPNSIDLQYEKDGDCFVRGGIVRYHNHLTPRHENPI